MIPNDLLQFMALPPERLGDITLSPYPTPQRETGVCPSQAVAWLAGEGHTDRPKKLRPIIGHIVDTLAESLNEADHTRWITPCLTPIMHTRNHSYFENLRQNTAVLWAINIKAATWLALAGFHEEANYLKTHRPSTTTPPQHRSPISWNKGKRGCNTSRT